jgi:UDP-N-acetylmuramyl pentapeptide synthase
MTESRTKIVRIDHRQAKPPRPAARLLGPFDARDLVATALENGAQLEDVQKAAGHRDPSTTKLYDRRSYNPEKAASFFATYREKHKRCLNRPSRI